MGIWRVFIIAFTRFSDLLFTEDASRLTEYRRTLGLDALSCIKNRMARLDLSRGVVIKCSMHSIFVCFDSGG